MKKNLKILPRGAKTILIFFVTLLLVCNIYSLFPTHAADILSNPQALVEQGRKLYETGELTRANTILLQAVQLFKSGGDKLGEAMTLSNLSLVAKKLGELNKAESYIAQSLEILTKSEVRADNVSRLEILAESLDIQGQIQLELGEAEKALNTWKLAANTYDKAKNEVGVTRCLINQSIAQQALGMYRQARANLEEISPRLEKQSDSLIKATALRSLGDVLQLTGDLDNSTKILQQSRDIATKLQSPSHISAALISLGNTQLALGKREVVQDINTTYEQSTPLRCKTNQNLTKYPLAIQFYNQAAQSYIEAANISTSPLTQVQAQLNQLDIQQKLQQWSEAQKLSSQIKTKLNTIPPSQASIYAQINLAQNSICLKQATAANNPSWKEIAQSLAISIQQADKINDKRSQAFALGALGALYLENKDINNAQKLTEQGLAIAIANNATDITYLWQWQLGYILKAKGDVENAINSYKETVNTLKDLRNDLVALNPDVQFSFRDNVEPVYRQFVDLLLEPENQKSQKQLHSALSTQHSTLSTQKNLRLAREAIEGLQLTELENFFREACLLPKAKQIDDIVDKIDPAAAVIYPIILKDRLEIIVKLPNQAELRHYTTYKPLEEVESVLEQLQKKLREPDRTNDIKNLSQQVYSWMIKPIENELPTQKIKTLVFVLDGSLRNIPMAVLYDATQKQYLIQKYAISLAPGLQLIDPKPLERKELNALAGGVSQQMKVDGRSFSSLENVPAELQKILSAIPNSKELLNQTFTKANVQNQIQRLPYTVVHMATHGEFSSNADKTFILAWEKLLKVKDFDNLLRLREQSESRPIELLVLSACQTATGDKRATLGLAGIAVRAGARSTLATLWSVDDNSTAEIMIKFYQALANTNVPKAEALRLAQVSVLTNDENPYLWAPYVLVGNWL
ncbi:CHAT domain-containing protein [Dulcicalothrix desertica]|nr:CHAT domain-containing protein [Dulcicalothrix desertica]TWH54385.1 CHAT domain-containing protein [Dulcicalothrix desertica PCC 7102]